MSVPTIPSISDLDPRNVASLLPNYPEDPVIKTFSTVRLHLVSLASTCSTLFSLIMIFQTGCR
ncbi:MAG: hypothetical protein ACLP5H_23055 [Desulfomonilaceae bacterium]